MIWLLLYIAIGCALTITFARAMFAMLYRDPENQWFAAAIGALLAVVWPVVLVIYAVRRVAFDSDTIESTKGR